MVQVSSKRITLGEFLKLPETKPACEYIEGQVVQKPMPKGKHSILQGELVARINQVLKPQRIARAFPELRCTFGERSLVPDVAVLSWNDIPRDDRGEVANTFNLAPDWVIEILSPEQNQTKVTKNILHCLRDRTQMGWLIDPSEYSILVYRQLQNIEIELFDQAELALPVPEFASDIQLKGQDLWAWLSE
jgi:Uma2 family endonuclease